MIDDIIHSSLSLKDFTVNVHIGTTTKEQKKTQQIILNIIIRFPSPPPACETDELADSICYKELTDLIHTFCAHRRFNLLEHLGYELYKFIKSKLAQNINLWLSVAKTKPVPNLANSVFNIGDWHDNLRFGK